MAPDSNNRSTGISAKAEDRAPSVVSSRTEDRAPSAVSSGTEDRAPSAISSRTEDRAPSVISTKAEGRVEKSFRRSFLPVFLAVLLLDRLTKELSPLLPASGLPLIPGVLGLRYFENSGAAFSLFSGWPRLLGVLSLVILVAAFLWLRKKHLAPFPLLGLALMAGGAAGNMLDRLIRGFVPDMIETLFISFPVFNVADSCLTVGCALMMVSLLFRPKDWEKGTET